VYKRQVYYFQVDNPLLPVLDPPFLGFHILHGSDFTTKVVPKTGPKEKMGVLARVNGRTRVVEYIHLTEERARERDGEGRLLFWAGNVAVHAISLDFVARFAGGIELPFHVAQKPASVLGPEGDFQERIALKLETFVFDAIPLARSSLAVEVERAEEFAPVKASEGEDTPARARAMMVEKAARWLERAGVRVPRKGDGTVAAPIEISPLTALFQEDLQGKVPADLDWTRPVVL